MKKTLLAAGAVVALSTSFTAGAAENDKPQYLSDRGKRSGERHNRTRCQ
jgi:nucleoside-specific outer membrane channel protein Tsx